MRIAAGCVRPRKVISMDILFLGLTLGFFALTFGLVKLCEKV